MRKKKKTPELNRIRIAPMIIITFVLVGFLSIMLIGQKNLMSEYLTSSKIREAAIPIERIHNILLVIGFDDSKEVSDCYDGFKALDDSFLGITVMDGDKAIYEIDNRMPDNMYEKPISSKSIKYVVNNNQVKFRTDAYNELYIGLISNFDINFSKRPLGENELFEMAEYSKAVEYAVIENTIRGYQDLWLYFFEDNGYETYIGYRVPLTDNDYQMCFIFSIGFSSATLIVFLVMVIFIIRVILSQYRIIKAYYYDKKTNGKNWEYFLEIVEKKKKTFDSSNTEGVVISIDVEKFAHYRSCYGEVAENNLLVNLYQIIKDNVPNKSIFARNEGARFGVAIQYKTIDELEVIVEKLINEMKNASSTVSLVFDVGAYIINRNEDISVSEMFNRATLAAAPYDKTLTFFNERMRADVRWERTVELDLDRAIQNREFEVYLQPKYSVKDEIPVAAEALIRWNHPKEGLLTPYKFIPIYEKTESILRIDDYMITGVARIQSTLLKEGRKVLPISVNLSRVHFIDENLANHICKLVDEYNVPHELIELELTESAFFDDKETIINTANKLKRLGFTVSLDDFGSGYSSLNSLSEIPIDVVKLDAGFFRNVIDINKSKIIIKEIISLAKELKISIVAEGIETREQVDFLAELECDMIQGYYFAKPMPLDKFNEEVENAYKK